MDTYLYKIYFYLLKVGWTIIFKKVTIPVFYFCLTKLVALSSNTILLLCLTIWGWLGLPRWILIMFAVSSWGWNHLDHPKTCSLRSWSGVGRCKQLGMGLEEPGLPGHLSFSLWSLQPISFQVAGHFTYLLRALKVPFQRVKQVRLYYLLWLVSEVTQCHFCHIPLFETVKG